MATKIKLKRSAIPNKAPVASQLEAGEVAVNTADGKLFLKKDDGTVVDTTKQIFQRNTNVTVNDTDATASITATVDGVEKIVIDVDGTTVNGPLTINGAETLFFNDANNDKYVAVQAPDTVDYSYVFKLPPNQPTDFSVLANDGAGGTVWTNPDTFGGNRVYASDVYGDDDNDGINLPVRTLKRAAQIAAGLGLRPRTDPGASAYNAKKLLEDNRLFIQDETIGFINANFVNFDSNYDSVKCERDTGILIDAASYDAALGTNYNAVTSGLAYQRANSAYVKNRQKIQTIGAINFAKSQVAAASTDSSADTALNAAFVEVIALLNGGTPSSLTFTNPSTATSDQIDAKTQLQQNRTFLQNEITAYINHNFTSYRYLDTVEFTCKRDIGLILDAVFYDAALGTTYNSITAGLAYRRANSAYVLSNQNIQTVEGIKKAKALALAQLAGNSTALSRVTAAFDTVIDILLNDYTVSSTPLSFDEPTNATQAAINAKDQLQANKEFIAAEIVAYVNANTPPAGYDQTKCARDVGYIIDALSYDILYQGTAASTEAARAYFVGTAVAQLALGQSTATVNAYTHLQQVVSSVLVNTTVTPTSGNTETQDTTGSVATSTEQTKASQLIKIFKDVIKTGNTAQMSAATAASVSWIDSGLATALNSLAAAKPTIISTASNFIKAAFDNFTYDSAKCSRDVGYIVDALTYDVLYGGDSATHTNALAYFVGTTGQLGTNQSTVTNLAYTHLQSVIADVVKGIAVTPTTGNTTSQVISGSSPEVISGTISVVYNNAFGGTRYGAYPFGFPSYGSFSVTPSGIISLLYYEPGTGTGVSFADGTYGSLVVSNNTINGAASFNITVDGITQTFTGGSGSMVVAGDVFDLTNKAGQTLNVSVTAGASSPAASDTEVTVLSELVDKIKLVIADGSIDNLPAATMPSISWANSGLVSAFGQVQTAKSTIVTDTIDYISTTYNGLTYNTSKCKRDVGLIVDAVIYDLILGGNSRSVEAGTSYLTVTEVINNQKPETLAAIEFVKLLSLSVIQNQSYPASYQNTISQITYPSLSAASSVSATGALFDVVYDILDTGVAPTIVNPEFDRVPITILVSAGDFYIDNPIIIPDKVSVVGDSLRSVVIRPLNANKDMFRVRNGAYLTGITFRDGLAPGTDVPSYTFNWSIAFDDPFDTSVDRSGYFGLDNNKPLITLSPYIQNCSIISFLAGNGIWVDGAKVQTVNTPVNTIEAENPINLADGVPQYGKSMVANAFTMISFGGTGWYCTNDAYAQIVSCFQIFCLNGSYCQSGGYLSITNSATNFGVYALRSSGYSQNSFEFDRGVVAGTGTNAGAITLTTIGTKRLPVNQYIIRLKDATTNADITSNFKSESITQTFNAATDVNASTNVFTIVAHGIPNGSSVIYSSQTNGPIPGMLEQGIYFVGVIDADTFRLYNDNSLSYQVDLLDVGTGTHKFDANVEEFYIGDTISSHSAYQSLTLEAGTYSFVPGQSITGLTGGVVNNAYVYSYDPVTDIVIVSNEFTIIDGNPQRILFTNSSVITSVGGSSSSINVDAATAITNVYFTAVSQVISTETGNVLQNPGNTVLQKINFHRPSIVNSSAHTWEFAGSGTDYNALPQNGGVAVPAYEQYSELPGRVYSSGTNELGDFKVGDFILAENKTGQITFRTRVSVGEIAVLKLSLSNVEVSEFSTDTGLGDNEPGGASDSRVSTQRAVRSFIANRLGNVIDKDASSNAVPGALVQLNAQGQINQDLLPPSRGVTTYNVEGWGSRLTLSEQIPAIQVISGDNASESYKQRILTLGTAVTVSKGDVLSIASPSGSAGVGFVKEDYTTQTEIAVVNVTGIFDLTTPVTINSVQLPGPITIATIGDEQTIVDNYYLKKDTSSQYLILQSGTTYNFAGLTTITGANSLAQGDLISTTPIYGVAYGLDNTTLVSGSGYVPGSGSVIYQNVALTTVTGTGTGARADITVTTGAVTAVELVVGGSGYVAGDTVSASAGDIGGGGSGFEIDILRADTRIYVNLVGSFIKFAATPTSPEYIEDNNAITQSVADLTAFVQKSFNAQDVSLGGDVNYGNSTINITAHGFTDGDALVYSHGGNLVVGNLLNQKTYWVKSIDADNIEIYNNYAFTSGSKVTFGTASSGTHNFRRFVVNTSESTLNVLSHGLSTGEPIRFSATNPPDGLADGGYYYIGSVTTNSFTLHTNKSDALASVSGVTAAEITIGDTGTGSASFTIQNVQIIGTVNTSSAVPENWGQIAQATFDASNIVSGVIVPSRLAALGSASDSTFLRGDSSWSYAVQNLRPASNSPVNVSGNFYTDTGTDYFYNSVVLDVDKVEANLGNPNYTNPGVVALNKAQFTVSSGETTIKSGVIDAGTLNGNTASYFANPANLVGTVSVNKGGTGLTSFTKGDILYSGSNDSLTQLNIGASNSVLTSNGLIPAWSTSLTLGGTLTVSGAVSVNDTTASTSSTTGALKVAGGVGVAGAIFTGESSTFAGLTSTAATTLSPANHNVILQPTGTGTVTINPATAGTINNTSIGATTRSTGAFTTLAANGAVTFASTLGITGLTTATTLEVTSTTGTTSATTGAVVITGGMGIGGSIWTAGTFRADGSIMTRDSGTIGFDAGGDVLTVGSNGAGNGQLIVNNLSNKVSLYTYNNTTDLVLSTNQSSSTGIKIDKASGDVTIQNNTASTSTTSGALKVVGGVGVAGTVTATTVKATTVEHSGLTLTAGTNIDQLSTISKSLTVNTTWQDTGIKAADLATGSYYIQIYANDNLVGGGHVDVYYSGIISWYAGTTNETTWDEIVLNRAGSSVGQGTLFVRLLRSSGSADNLKLQIAGTTINTGAATYTFKFRRLI
jgi:hypothetical protein